MTVTNLGLKNKTWTASREVDPNALSGSRKVYNLTYLLQTDSINDHEEDFLNALPSLRAFGRNGWVVDKSVREVDAQAGLWEGTVTVDSQPPTSTGNNPDLLNWGWHAETYEQVIPRDVITGDLIANSVNEPITVTTPIAVPVLTVSRIQQNFSPNTILGYMNKTNLTPFYGAPQDTALMADIRDEEVDIEGVKMRRVTYVVKFNLLFDYENNRFNGWTVQPLNVGTFYLSQAGNQNTRQPYIINGGWGKGLLNPNGTKTNTPNYLKFHKHLRANFNNLLLGPF